MVPSVGMTVHYLFSDTTSAAVITAVNGPLVDLIVFPAGELPSPVVNVSQGDGNGQWNWPPRI